MKDEAYKIRVMLLIGLGLFTLLMILAQQVRP